MPPTSEVHSHELRVPAGEETGAVINSPITVLLFLRIALLTTLNRDKAFLIKICQPLKSILGILIAIAVRI